MYPRDKKPYVWNGKDQRLCELDVAVKDFEHYSIENKRVYDVRKKDIFSAPKVENLPSKVVLADKRDASPARSDASGISQADSVVSVAAAPSGDFIMYPNAGSDEALLVSSSNPALSAWLPRCAARDYATVTQPNGSTIVTSSSLNLLRYVPCPYKFVFPRHYDKTKSKGLPKRFPLAALGFDVLYFGRATEPGGQGADTLKFCGGNALATWAPL